METRKRRDQRVFLANPVVPVSLVLQVHLGPRDSRDSEDQLHVSEMQAYHCCTLCNYCMALYQVSFPDPRYGLGMRLHLLCHYVP